jgi:hypothetical protein
MECMSNMLVKLEHPERQITPLSVTPNIEVVLRHFHRDCYKSCPLWVFCWRGLKSLRCYLWMNAVGTKIYVVRAAGA